MAQVSVNIRMDEDVKRDADALFRELGLNMTTAVNMFMRQALRKRAIPFTVAAPQKAKKEYYNEDGLLVREGVIIPKGEENDPFYSAANIRMVTKAIREAEAGKFAKITTSAELRAMEQA